MDPWSDPPLLPSLTLPAAPELPQAVLEVPRAQLPSYKPLVVPPSDLRPPPGIKGENQDKAPDKTKMVAKSWAKGDGYGFVTVSGAEKKYDHMLFASIGLVNGLPAVSVKFDENFTKATAKQKDQAWARLREQIESGSLNLFVDDIKTEYCK